MGMRMLTPVSVLIALVFWLGACGGSGGDADAGDAGDAGGDAFDAADGGGDEGGGDVGGDEGGGETDCRFDSEVSWDMLGEILQMESDDSGTCVWLKREDKCPEGWICKAHPFDLLQIRIGHGGRVVEQDDPFKLRWESTHHNWSDVGTASIDGTAYRLEGSGYGHIYNLSASGAENWGPVRLMGWSP